MILYMGTGFLAGMISGTLQSGCAFVLFLTAASVAGGLLIFWPSVSYRGLANFGVFLFSLDMGVVAAIVCGVIATDRAAKKKPPAEIARKPGAREI